MTLCRKSSAWKRGRIEAVVGAQADRNWLRICAPKAGFGRYPCPLCGLADWAAQDLSLARLAEGHVDALAILAEAGLEPSPGATYGVWAARPPADGTTAHLTADGWHLAGEKPFCSGSTRIDRALMTAECPDGYRLFDISVAENVVEGPSRVVARSRYG